MSMQINHSHAKTLCYVCNFTHTLCCLRAAKYAAACHKLERMDFLAACCDFIPVNMLRFHTLGLPYYIFSQAFTAVALVDYTIMFSCCYESFLNNIMRSNSLC